MAKGGRRTLQGKGKVPDGKFIKQGARKTSGGSLKGNRTIRKGGIRKRRPAQDLGPREDEKESFSRKIAQKVD